MTSEEGFRRIPAGSNTAESGNPPPWSRPRCPLASEHTDPNDTKQSWNAPARPKRPAAPAADAFGAGLDLDRARERRTRAEPPPRREAPPPREPARQREPAPQRESAQP